MPKGRKLMCSNVVCSNNCSLCDYTTANFKDLAFQKKILDIHLLKVHGIENPTCINYDFNIDPENHTLTHSQRLKKFT